MIDESLNLVGECKAQEGVIPKTCVTLTETQLSPIKEALVFFKKNDKKIFNIINKVNPQLLKQDNDRSDQDN